MIRLLRRALAIGLILLLVGGGWFYLQISSPLVLSGDRVEFHIASGSGMRTAAREIAASGVAVEPWKLVLLGKILRVEGAIKAGSYEIDRGVSLLELLRKLTRGDVSLTEIAFIEGWTFRQIRERLNTHPDVQHDTRGLSDEEVMRLVGAPGTSPEGWFFPDTYLFSKRSRDVDILARAHRAMQRHLAREWEARAEQLPLASPYQALILASIVEKETGKEQDRPLVAAVFVNGLRQGMRLQTDPTVIYGLGERFDGNLRKSDLLADTPFNT